MKLIAPGTEIDGFLVEDCIHTGGMALIYRVHYAGGREPNFEIGRASCRERVLQVV